MERRWDSNKCFIENNPPLIYVLILKTAVAYATAQTVDDTEGVVEEDESGEIKTEPTSNQDAVQTLIDAVQELIDNRQKPSWNISHFTHHL